eukprot:scaffold779_cov205-Alexandrium_tamarense.AAC.26
MSQLSCSVMNLHMRSRQKRHKMSTQLDAKMPETTAGTESRLKNNDLLADDIGTLGFGRSFSIVGCNDDGD